MIDKRLKVAEEVLDYWYTIEFLGQDSYETCTDEKQLRRDLNKYKKSSQKAKQKKNYITVFEKLSKSTNIEESVKKQAKLCSKPIWGNLTFYIGKVSRQKCIESFASALGITLNQVEKNWDDIALLSFQCDSHGEYIDHSFSLSTIVWALSEVSGSRNSHISEILSEQAYSQALKKFETKYFKQDMEDSSQNGKDANDGISKIDAESITMEKISEIYADIKKTFEKYVGEDSFQENVGLKYQLFEDQKSKEQYEDDDYLGLSHDFYSSDIKMVRNRIKERPKDFRSGMLYDLVSYICAPYSGSGERRKHDMVKPKDKRAFFFEMSEILNPENAPIAKWPSRYMPALMQQVAVNFAVSNRNKGIFRENGCIFSVNGPPGTGKTTLLKEIVANNIVKKADLLCRYIIPDDAFREVSFKKGEYNGAYVPPRTGYHKSTYPSWYEFKDEQIADYGILVASCNNAAVENISKELPLETGIKDNLKVSEKDNAQLKDELRNIRQLFLASSRESPENAERDHEVYFTKYAKKLFSPNEKDDPAWGLVAVPLGKKTNISTFYSCVIRPLWEDYMMSNDEIDGRLPYFKKAKEEFLAQRKKVVTLRDELKKLGDVTVEAAKKADLYHQKKEDLNVNIEEFENTISNFDSKIQNARNVQRDIEVLHEKEIKQRAEIVEIIKEHNKKQKEYLDREKQFKEEADKTRKSIGIFTKIFLKRKYHKKLALALSYMEQADACNKEASVQDKASSNAYVQLKKSSAKEQSLSKELEKVEKQIESLEKEQKKKQNSLKEIEKAKQEAEKARANKEKTLRQYSSSGELRSFQTLDESFVDEVLSNGEKSTAAQTANPWMTEEYNREREKLLYLALQVTREFVLSSRACRRNLLILAQYWGLRIENGQKIKFHPEDKEAMMGSLMNTLFLLTPVVSSTFASVGSLLKDIKEPGAIGTLIIDEAGQAQPQMAVGALYRSKRSIIVGDPKQVEPVVTDDLDLLKRAYSNPVYANYKNKSLSVQSCADTINPFGTFLENGTDTPEWVGCPLLVHRRCISPMFEISNRISYNGIMKQQTLPPSEEKEKIFLFTQSQWFNYGGEEAGNGNHFVKRQGNVVRTMVSKAFEKSPEPNLYIISPFSSVVNGIRDFIKAYKRYYPDTILGQSDVLDDWLYSHVGTVHKFQGKEANEAIFLLGCDEHIMNGYAVTGFVNSNIVNVAATRAKYRLYVVGNEKVWRHNQYVAKMKEIMDKYYKLNNVPD